MPKNDVHELIAELGKQYARVREKQEYVELKETELCSDNEMSFSNHMQAKELLAVEQTLLSRRALRVKQSFQKSQMMIDPQTAKLLRDSDLLSTSL